MKKIALLSLSALMSLASMAQTDDPVIMKINGKDIHKSEFEYSFRKNNSDGVIDKKTVKEYVPLYVNFKLKVAAAEEARYDTLANVRKDLVQYKEQMLLPTLVDSAYIEREARATYDNTAKRFEGQDLLDVSHILILSRQDATAEQDAAAKARIDSIRQVLLATPKDQQEEVFGSLASSLSDDPGSARNRGALPSFAKGMMVPEFEEASYALQPGELSMPVKSAYGYHLIYMRGRHQFEPYEFHHDAILRFLDSRGIKQRSANARIDSLAKQDGLTRTDEIQKLFNEMIANDAEQRNLSQEYYDGTMMYEICNTTIWTGAQKDSVAINNFFKANKNKYTWDTPRFCGIVIKAKNAETLAKALTIAKATKKEELRAKAIDKALNTDSVRIVRIETGLFKKGDRAIIDRDYYKVKDRRMAPSKTYPETAAYGKLIKKPRSVEDVRSQVAIDYQNSLEQQWVNELRQKFSVEIFEDVVATVKEL